MAKQKQSEPQPKPIPVPMESTAGTAVAADPSLVASDVETIDPGQPRSATLAVRVSIPLGEAVGYCQQRVDLNLSGPQAETLRRIVAGLARAEESLRSCRPIRDGADALAWILEQLEPGSPS
jgi:hypothetical protein